MESFKYKGTPEQMAKVAEWALKNGARWDHCGPEYDTKYSKGDVGIVFAHSHNVLLYIDFYCSADEPALELTPALELEIFGNTAESLITEDSWKENTGVRPDLPEGTLVDTKWDVGCNTELGDEFDEWDWGLGMGITHWRFHKPEDAKYFQQPRTASCAEGGGEANYYQAPKTGPKKDLYLEDAYNNTRNLADQLRSIGFDVVSGDANTPTAGKVKSDGGSSSYYELTIRTKDGEFKCQVGDVIRAMVGNDFDLGNVVKATRRIWCDSQGQGKEGIDMEYDVNKCGYFLNEFLEAHK